MNSLAASHPIPDYIDHEEKRRVGKRRSCAVPTFRTSLAKVGTLRFAHPTNLLNEAMARYSPPSICRPISAIAF
jgi:hypothetical protein